MNIYIKIICGVKKTKFFSRTAYYQKNITIDKLTKADIFLVRQVLQYLSNNDIKLFLKNIKYKCKFLIVQRTIHQKKILNKNIFKNFNIKKDLEVLLYN